LSQPADLTAEKQARDRAIWFVRLGTLGAAAVALALSWLFGDLAQAYFSGQPPKAQSSPPDIPPRAAPVQKAPPVIKTIVHHPFQPGAGAPGSAGSTPRPPSQGPAPAPPPPPPPACKSTPSKPC
jgi:hypothetical protein